MKMVFNGEYYWSVVVAGLTPLILWASWIDYKEKRVPNKLNLFIILSGLAVQVLWNGGWGLLSGVEGLALGFGLLIIPWAMYMMGAGDVKLLAGMGAWMGPEMVLWTFVIGAIIGGIASLIMIAVRRRWGCAIQNFQLASIKCTNMKLAFSNVGAVKTLADAQLIPYGVPLTGGALIVMALKVLSVW
jgi:prepilin peptidase CpaA